VLLDYLTHLQPLVDRVLPELPHAVITQVLDFSLVWTALGTEVVEEDVDLEVVGQVLAVVLANVLWAQLHLACFDVVAVLDERGVEHDSTEGVRREALVSEENLNVAVNGPPLALRLGQQEYYLTLLAFVLASGRVTKNLRGLQSLTVVDFKVWNASLTRQGRHLLELNSSQPLHTW
jgi:hypothetical protein